MPRRGRTTRSAGLNEGLPQKGKRCLGEAAPCGAVEASMKGFPRRESDTGRCGRLTAGRPCLNEGLPQKGKRWRRRAPDRERGRASMKGFPRRESDSGLEKSLLVR